MTVGEVLLITGKCLVPEQDAAVLIAHEYYGNTDPDSVEAVLNNMLAYVQSTDKWAMEYAIDMGIISEDHPMFSYIDWKEYAEVLLVNYRTYRCGTFTCIMPEEW